MNGRNTVIGGMIPGYDAGWDDALYEECDEDILSEIHDNLLLKALWGVQEEGSGSPEDVSGEEPSPKAAHRAERDLIARMGAALADAAPSPAPAAPSREWQKALLAMAGPRPGRLG